jgi:cytidine deaminase
MNFIKTDKKDLTASDQTLVKEATSVLEKSYSPYSGLKVGASFLLSDNTIVCGANIENASYSLCMCAERVGLYHAKMLNPKVIIKKMVITAKHQNETINSIIAPCGACRQVLLEQELNQKSNIEILLTSEDVNHVINVPSWKELVPLYFDKNILIKE